MMGMETQGIGELRMRGLSMALCSVVAIGSVLFASAGSAAADDNVTQAWNPGPPACIQYTYLHVNTQQARTEISQYIRDVRFGDHLYRQYTRFTTSGVKGDTSPINFPRTWMDTCEGMGSPQQVLSIGKFASIGLINGDLIEFRDTTLARKSGGSWNEVRGEIHRKYRANGGFFEFGFPLTSEIPTPDRVGAFNHFEKHNYSIYWSPSTGAHHTSGVIKDAWARYGWENSFLGFPTSDLFYSGSGRYGEHFEGGSIYYSGSSGVHEVHGAIRDKWASLGWEKGRLGMPTSDEYGIPGGGRRSTFQNNCRIDWFPTSGAIAYCATVPPF